MLSVKILVLNYNGEGLLGQTIPTLLRAVSRSRYPCSLAVIDNESADGSVRLLREKFPQVEVLPRPNRVLCSFNGVCGQVSEDIVVLLNNDLKAREDFLDPLIAPFEKDERLFLVAPKCLDYEGSKIMGGASHARFAGGILRVSDSPDEPGASPDRAQPTFSAGSAGAYDRRKFMALGGYDDIYLPGTMEDVDLCFRAWRSGWSCLYEPRSVVYHLGQHSFHRRFGKRGTAAINARNNFVFLWKNIDDGRFWARHVLCLAPRLLYHAARGQTYWVSAFVSALGMLPDVRARRRARGPMPFGERRAIALGKDA